MQDNEFEIKTKLWIWPGIGAWHFVTIGKQQAKEIKALMPVRRGFGSIRVTATIGRSKWKTSIFPTKEKEYLLPVKADVRKAENVKAGDTVNIKIIL